MGTGQILEAVISFLLKNSGNYLINTGGGKQVFFVAFGVYVNKLVLMAQYKYITYKQCYLVKIYRAGLNICGVFFNV